MTAQKGSGPRPARHGAGPLHHVSRGVVWLFRGLSLLAELGLLVTGGMVMLSDGASDELALMTLWDCLAFVYLALAAIGLVVRSRTSDPSVDDMLDDGTPPPFLRRVLAWYWGLMPFVFSLLGLTAALSVLLLNQSTNQTDALMTKVVAAIAMVAAWLLLHGCYARRYQWFYEREGGGLEFPGLDPSHRPSPVDFLYFSITLGSSFATSDTSVTSTRMRAHVVMHSILAFFYNAIVLAVAFRIITGG